LIIGAGPTGMSTAFHLGEHSLVLERRNSLEHFNDYSHDLEMGTAHGGAVGDENAGADGHGPPAALKTLFITCGTQGSAESRDQTLIHVARWRPPDLAPPGQERTLVPPSVRTLRPLLRGELRMGAHVVRVVPETHLAELADGHRIVYDKLVSTLSLAATERLVTHDLPGYLGRDESLRSWLGEHDIEVVDRKIQEYFGDLDEFAAGKRVANLVGHALTEKYGITKRTKASGIRLFKPRLVNASAAPSTP
jgi:hypothetical protein